MTHHLRQAMRAALLLMPALLFATPDLASACECDSPQVRHNGAVIKVFPTHRDDTAHLRCALRVASRTPGHTVLLAPGQFWTRQLWATGFVGTLKGSGADKTVLSNPGPLQVATGNVVMSPPSATNLWPALITFVDGDFTVSDLTIRIKGPQVATTWNLLGFLDIENAMIGEIMVTGSKADASFTHLAVEGTTVEQGYAAPYGEAVSIIFQPTLGGYAKPLSGRFAVTGCTFRNVGIGFNALGIEHGQLTWHANRILDSGAGFEVWDSAHTILQATNNEIEATGYATGLPFPYPGINIGGNSFVGLGLASSTFLFADNTILGSAAGQYGISIDPDVFEQNHVIVVGNDISAAGGIYLGANTTGCIVKREGAPVLDAGSGNYLLTP